MLKSQYEKKILMLKDKINYLEGRIEKLKNIQNKLLPYIDTLMERF
mgnify:CR=1 FL=1